MNFSIRVTNRKQTGEKKINKDSENCRTITNDLNICVTNVSEEEKKKCMGWKVSPLPKWLENYQSFQKM